MKLSEHTNFTDSKNTYQMARFYWKDFFNKIKQGSNEFIDNKYQNGTEIFDGNPLYTAYYKNNQAIRIIQNRVTAHEPIFTCWIQKSYIKEQPINELVIYLQPLEYLVPDITKIVQLHVNGKLSNRFADRFNRKYQIRWDLLRSKRIISRIEKLSLFDQQLTSGIEINQSSLKDFSSLVSVENFYINVASQRVATPISLALKKVENKISKLNSVITLKGSFSMAKAPSLSSYNVKVKSMYVSKVNYKRTLISKINDLKEELAELKQEL